MKSRIHEAILCAAAMLLYVVPLNGQVTAFDEQHRPQVHCSPGEHWTNDPNGLVYYRAEYHLFFSTTRLETNGAHEMQRRSEP